MTTGVTPEFSRRLSLAQVPATGLERDVTATSAECAALASRFQLPAIAELHCHFVLRPESRGRLRADGRLQAAFTQICVASLEPFDTRLDEDFTVYFVPSGQESDDLDPDLPDEIPYEGGQIDLGEAAAEQMALALDPYPRKPGIMD